MKQIITQYGGLKREIYILFIGRLVTAMGSFVWPMLTFFLTTKLGLDDGTATLMIATASVLSFPAALLGGKLADRFSRKAIIIVFDCITVSMYLLAAILPMTLFTAILLFAAGLFQTIESPAYDALNADYSTSRQREKAYSLSYLGFNLGYIVGASVAGILFEKFVRLAFCINGLAIFVSTVLILFFVHKKNAITEDAESLSESYSEYEQPIDEKISVLAVLRQRPVLIGMLLIGCLASMPVSLMGLLLPLQLKDAMGEAGATLYGYLNSLNGFVVIVFTPILTVLLKKLTEIPKTIIGLILFLVGNLFFSWANKLVTMPEETAQLAALEDTVRRTLDLTWEKMSAKYDELVEYPFYKIPAFKESYLSGVMADTFGYAGTEIIRRTVGSSKVMELNTVTDPAQRARMERILLNMGIRFVMERESLCTGDDAVAVFKTAAE